MATYESFAAVLQRSAFRPGTIVADEIHLIADQDRGPGRDYIGQKIPPKDEAALKELAERILEENPKAEDVVDLLPRRLPPRGTAQGDPPSHRAGLPRQVSRARLHADRRPREPVRCLYRPGIWGTSGRSG